MLRFFFWALIQPLLSQTNVQSNLMFLYLQLQVYFSLTLYICYMYILLYVLNSYVHITINTSNCRNVELCLCDDHLFGLIDALHPLYHVEISCTRTWVCLGYMGIWCIINFTKIRHGYCLRQWLQMAVTYCT